MTPVLPSVLPPPTFVPTVAPPAPLLGPAGAAATLPALPPTIAPRAVPAGPGLSNSPPTREFFVAAATVSAEWPLPDDSDQAAAAIVLIREKAWAACVGVKESPKLSRDEKSLLQRCGLQLQESVSREVFWGAVPIAGGYSIPAYNPYARSMPYAAMNGSPNVNASVWSPPSLLYVGVLSDSQRKEATARAFARARQQAAELAEAAGRQLGPIQSLFGGGDAWGQSGFGVTPIPTPSASGNPAEFTADIPERLNITTSVSVTFRLAPAGPNP